MSALPEQVKIVGDQAAIVTAALSFFKMIPWPEIAAFLAAVYTLMRIVEFFVLKNNKSKSGKRRNTDA